MLDKSDKSTDAFRVNPQTPPSNALLRTCTYLQRLFRTGIKHRNETHMPHCCSTNLTLNAT